MTKIKNNKIDRLPLTNDYIFKRVFAKQGNENILKDFLEAILEIKIQKIEVQNPELPKNNIDEKLGVLDIKVQLDNNIIVDVEMQMENEYNMDARTTTYMSKMVAGQLQRGEDYIDLKKSIVINILNFDYYKRNCYHNIAKMKFLEPTKDTYVDMGYKQEEEIATRYIEMHFIELKKFIKKNPDTKAKINQWLWLLAGEEEKIEMAKKENKEVEKAVEILDEVSMNREERERYEAILKAEFNRKVSMYNVREEGKKEGKKEGIKQGKIEGRKEQKIEIAEKMMNKGMTREEIHEITGLKIEEIEIIRKSRK